MNFFLGILFCILPIQDENKKENFIENKVKGIVKIEYRYSKQYNRFWHYGTYLINQENDTFNFSQRVPYLGDSCAKVLSELITKEPIYEKTIQNSKFFRKPLKFRDGFHIGGETYSYIGDTSKIIISFKIKGKGYIIEEFCFHNPEYDEVEIIECEFSDNNTFPYIFVTKTQKIKPLSRKNIKQLEFEKYLYDEFPVGYCH